MGKHMDKVKKEKTSAVLQDGNKGTNLDLYVELFEAGDIPGGKEFTKSFRVQIDKEIQDMKGK